MQRLSHSKIRRSEPIHTIHRWCGIFVVLVTLRASGSKNDDLGRRERRWRALSLALGACAMGKVRAVGVRTRKEEGMRCRCAKGNMRADEGRAGERRRNRCTRWVERRLRGWETEEPRARASNPAPRTIPPAHEHPIVHLRVSLIRLVESPPLTRPSHTHNRRRRRAPRGGAGAADCKKPKAGGRRTNSARRARRHSRMDLDPNQHRPTGTARPP
jgi:hypothetical protein